MDKKNLITYIQQVMPVSRPKVEEIVSHFQPIHIEKNDYFIREGKAGNQYMFLESGLIRSYVSDLEGNEVTTAFYSNNQMVFEVSSFFRKSEAKENFQALEECRGWFISFEQLQFLFHSVPEFREFGRMVLVMGFIAFKERSLSLINERAEQRYETLIRSRPEIFQKAPLKYIASYLGITDTSLSRIRKTLARK